MLYVMLYVFQLDTLMKSWCNAGLQQKSHLVSDFSQGFNCRTRWAATRKRLLWLACRQHPTRLTTRSALCVRSLHPVHLLPCPWTLAPTHMAPLHAVQHLSVLLAPFSLAT